MEQPEINTTNIMNNNTENLNNNTTSAIPEYVCCVITEAIWTWFATILFSVILLLFATLKYCRKYLSKPKFDAKNLKLLKRSLIADDGDAVGKIKMIPVKVEEFIRYCNFRRKHVFIDTLEFDKTLENSDNDPTITFSNAKQHLSKNQNQDVVTQDGNRVILLGQNNDYINATRIVPYQDYLDRSWIVTQGPMDGTIADFWKLIWQENTRLIIMLTKTFEVVRIMCSQYWPLTANSHETYGDFKVILQKEENYAHFKVRHFILEHGGEQKSITQFHYISWPLSAQPDSTNLLLFRRHIWSAMNEDENAGPPLVHCHDGGGRSGTFLAIEANLALVDLRNEVDVFGTVNWLHKQRPQLVSHPGFYRLIYDVIEDYIRCGHTCISLGEMLSHNNFDQRKSEFAILATLRPQYTIGDCAAGHRAENRDKNRNVMIVPPDDNRPYLTSFQSNTTTDYINAVFVDGYCQAKAMIITEWPMQSTIANFWSMVYDHDCSTVVVLNNPPGPRKVARSNTSFVKFWPDQDYATYGPVFSVQTVDKLVQPDFSVWQLRLGKKEIAPHRKFQVEEERRTLLLKAEEVRNSEVSLNEAENKKDEKSKLKKNNNNSSLSTMLLQGLEAPAKLVRLYQVNAWPQDSQVPNSSDILINLMGDVEKWHNDVKDNHMNKDGTSDHLTRVAVVSCDGMSRVGVYCSTFTSVEQVYATQKVDIFNAVKCARNSRPQMVDSIAEYNYIHNTVKQFIVNITK